MEQLDQLQIHFDGDSLFLMNVSLAVIMFGVALDIDLQDFRRISGLTLASIWKLQRS